MSSRLTDDHFEDLSAWLDGELDADRSAQVERLVSADASWRAAATEMKAVDDLLDIWQTPQADVEAPRRILEVVRRKTSMPARIIRWLAPLAAAAAVLLAVALYYHYNNPRPRPTDIVQNPAPNWQAPVAPVSVADEGGRAVADLNEVDRFAVKNMELVRDLDVLENFQTIKAMDSIEGS